MSTWQLAKQLNEKQALLEMAKIGEIDEFSIFVYSNDNGNIAHFHIVDSNTLGSQFSCCVCIESLNYFYHTGKEDKLNSKLRKLLIRFLQSPEEEGIFNTNWDALLYEWNKNNSRRKVSRELEMPDYTKLPQGRK